MPDFGSRVDYEILRREESQKVKSKNSRPVIHLKSMKNAKTEWCVTSAVSLFVTSSFPHIYGFKNIKTLLCEI